VALREAEPLVGGRGPLRGLRVPAKLAAPLDQLWLRGLAALTQDYRFVTVDGFRVSGSQQHQLMLYWLAKGTYERHTRTLFRASLEPGLRVLDLGAHIGWYSLLAAAAVGPTGAVHAFEPDPGNCRFLRHNVALNGLSGIVQISSKAIADYSGSTRFFADARNSLKSSSELASARADAIEVECTTIDDALPSAESIDVVKLDVEGAELAALAGMERTLGRAGRLVMFVECCPHALAQAGGSVAELLEVLEGHDFRVELIHEKQRTVTSDLDELFAAECAGDERYYVNLVCRRGFGRA
jgi:FkbM family methyltransferase